MDFRRGLWIVVAVIALRGIATAQAPENAPPPVQIAPLISSLTQLPAPYDPLELVPDGARPVTSAEERAATIELLATARRLSNVRLHAYDLKTSFTTYGSLSSDGRWTLEDTSPSRDIYRWTAQGPWFSAVFLHNGTLLSSDQPSGTIPLRLMQVRDAIFGVYPGIGRYASLRVATGNLDGGEVRCVLVAHGIPGNATPAFSSGRSFDELEYCIDSKTGLLATYSPVPGLYVHYDYSNAFHFHDQMIPNGFTISENGRTVIEAKTDSVTDAPSANQDIFKAEGLNPLGAGPAAAGPVMIRSSHAYNLGSPDARPQVVVVHGMISPSGRLGETEVLASTNPALNDAAVQRSSAAHFLQAGEDAQPGTTPLSREAFFTVEFVPIKPCQNLGPGGAPGMAGAACGSPAQPPSN
ncbi:MAG: hypothetical protein WAJ86_02745 [Candidatus Acidiferrales bacterium]